MTVELSNRNLKRILHMQLPELLVRSRQETSKLVDRIRLSAATQTNIERGRDRLARFLDHCEKHFFEGAFDPRVPEMVKSANADECQAVLIAAHHASGGRFNLLGYRNLQFGNPIDWHLDPVSRRRAPFVHWSQIDPLDCATVGDSKVIWELNRHQWLVHLAQAWQLTGDVRYAQAVVHSMLTWLRLNPPGIGINWASSLEVSFRLIAWCWALILIRDSGALTPDVFLQFEEAADAHASHVERYLSYYFSPNTHLTGEALGLFYAGVVFHDNKRAERWRSTATRILLQEIERQVLPDGVYFERSTCYQRYTADIYLHFLMLAKRSHIEVPEIVSERVKSMLDVLVNLRQPDGSMPSIGDADDGMLLPLSAASPDDYRATFSTAAVWFSNPVYAWAAGRLASDTSWLLGARAAADFDALEKKTPDQSSSRVFPVGGFVSMRSGWDEKAHAMIFDAGPLGCPNSAGHGHADLLSIQCSAFGERYLVDAGTCCYTADRGLRDYFRSTAAHSAVSVDGVSQADPAGPFSWRNRCSAHLLRWAIDETFVHADAVNDAYRRLADPVSHRRRVVFLRSKCWVVIDDLCGSKNHRFDVRFQFAPMQVEAGDDGWVRSTRSGQRGLLLRAFGSTKLDVAVREGIQDPMEGWVSSGYGRKEPAPAVVYSATTKLPARIVTVLWPTDDINEVPKIEVTSDLKGRPFRLTLQDPFESIIIDDEDDDLVIQQ